MTNSKLIKRTNTRIYRDEEATQNEATKHFYCCLEHKSFLPNKHSVGLFALSAQRLYFMTDYVQKKDSFYGNSDIYCSMQLKEITSISASYEKRTNILSLIFGLIFLVSAALLFVMEFPVWGSLILLGVGLFCLIAAFTSARIKSYKICIGTTQGGITIMGSNSWNFKQRMIWNSPTTFYYKAVPIERQFYDFIESVNSHIALLQERGDYV